MTKTEEREYAEEQLEHLEQHEAERLNIDHPSYYTQGIEAIDFIDSHNLNFSLGNAIKYIIRAGLKDGEPTQEALRKAIWYLEHEIARLNIQELLS